MFFFRAASLFLITAFCEIAGCYLVYLWVRQKQTAWLLLPALGILGVFAWLLTLHPHAAGRTYAAYGGVYVFAALLWLRVVEHQKPDFWDMAGAGIALLGMALIYLGPHSQG
ncbi:MAG: YnfA family protein [Candidatus Korobacteraceae bacterium]